MEKARLSPDLKENYDSYYESGTSEWRRLCAVDKVANISRLCDGIPHETVLEIGAGDGSVLQRLSETGFGGKLFALEISSSGLDAISARSIDGLVECREFNGYDVPYGKDEFDLVVLSHVIEHVEKPEELLGEAGRVARHVFVEVPLECTARHPQGDSGSKAGHINFYTSRSIEETVVRAGLQVLARAVVTPSRAVHRHRYGRRGNLQYLVKALFLAVAPRSAQRVFVYHAALLCR